MIASTARTHIDLCMARSFRMRAARDVDGRRPSTVRNEISRHKCARRPRPVDAQPKSKTSDATPIAELQIDPSTPLFRVRSFSLLFTTRVASTTATQMLAVVVGWHVYEITDSAL